MGLWGTLLDTAWVFVAHGRGPPRGAQQVWTQLVAETTLPRRKPPRPIASWTHAEVATERPRRRQILGGMDMPVVKPGQTRCGHFGGPPTGCAATSEWNETDDTMSKMRSLTVGVLAIAALLASAGAAEADIYDKFPFSNSESGTFTDCDTTWSYDFHNAGFVLLRLDDDGDLLLVQGNGSFTNTVTNLTTGRHITFSGHDLFREVEAVRVGDIVTLDVRQSGMPTVITSDTGKVIARDLGLMVLRQTFEVVDHELVFLDEQVVADHGGHPLYYTPFCAVALPATS